MNKPPIIFFLAAVLAATACSTLVGHKTHKVVFFEAGQLPPEMHSDFMVYRSKSAYVARKAGYDVDFREFQDIDELNEFIGKDARSDFVQCRVGLIIVDSDEREYHCGVMTDLDFQNILNRRDSD